MKLFHHFYLLLFVVSLAACGQIRDSAVDTARSGFIIQETTIARLHQSLRTGSTNCVDVVNAYLNRIRKYDQSSRLNAIVAINPEAVKLAESLDREFRSSEKMRYLHCVPVIVKDNIETLSMPTTGGSMVFRDYMSMRDAVIISRLKKAGAIILAKSNMAEWAFSPYFTISSTAGETRNAYDLNRVPAGSSGGTASAVAANFGLVGLGTDTGNSVRGPASHLSLTGLRPTQDLFNQTGIIPLLKNRDMSGPMTRTVEDAARLMNVLVGDDAGPAVDYTARLSTQGLRGVRVGVLRALIDTDTADPEITDLMEQALADMKKSGAVLVDPLMVPDLEKLTKDVNFCSRFRYDINNYFASLTNAPPVMKLKDIVDTKRFHESSAGGMEWAMSESRTPDKHDIPCVDVEGDPRRKALRDAVIGAMDRHRVEVLVYPGWNNPPRVLGDLVSPHGNNSPVIAPHAGLPAITVPMGFTSEQLPAGLQIMGRARSEAQLFAYAYAYEQATQHRHPPPAFP